MSYLERYTNGEYEQVWDNLLALGAQVREEQVYPEALAVAQETMRRVRQNIELLINRLVQVGFIFGYDHRIQPAFGEHHPAENRRTYLERLSWAREQPPVFLSAKQREEEKAERGGIPYSFVFDESEELEEEGTLAEAEDEMELPAMAAYIEEIEQVVGPVPCSIRAWYETVGGVNFYGYHAGWHQLCSSFLANAMATQVKITLMTHCDPLQVYPLNRAFMRQFRQDYVPGTRYTFAFAPDRFFKDDYSGGGGSPYSFYLPDASADAWLAEPFDTFVRYLRTSILSWAGFPGMADWPTVPQDDLTFLTEGLIPF
jgi:hypothetical protein